MSPQRRRERAIRGDVHYGAPLDQLEAMDRGGTVAALAAAREVGADRFVRFQLSGRTPGPPPGFDDAWWTSYYAAKHASDEALRTSGLRWTVIRPGALTDGAPTGHVSLSESLPLREIPRADVASLGIAILGDAASVGHSWDAAAGPMRFVTPSGRPWCPRYGGSPFSRSEQPGSRSRAVLRGEAVRNTADREALDVSVKPDRRHVSSDGPRHAPRSASCRPWGEHRIGPQRRAPATSRLMAAPGGVGPPCALAGGEVTANQPGGWIGAKPCSEVSGRHHQGCAGPHARGEIAAYASVGL
jgi:hypothetical protein